jgi:hypothetical protein
MLAFAVILPYLRQPWDAIQPIVWEVEMSRNRIFWFWGARIAVVLLGSTELAFAAESSSQALETFGIIGTWSTDCASPGIARLIFTSSMFGGQRMTEQFDQQYPNAPSKRIVYQHDIKSAVRITEEKMSITSVAVTINGNAISVSSPLIQPKTLLFEKVRNKLVLNNQMVLEKCFN